MYEYIIDEQLTLQILQPSHVNDLFHLTDTNREHLRPWMPWVDGTRTVQDSEEFIRFTLNNHANNAGFTTGIFKNGQLCGVVGFHQPNLIARHVSIGYWLGEDFQGKGIMTKACQTLIYFAFEDWHMNRIEIRVDVKNERSRAIANRLGFTQEGVLRMIDYVNENFVDMAVYSLLASEWLAANQDVTIDNS